MKKESILARIFQFHLPKLDTAIICCGSTITGNFCQNCGKNWQNTEHLWLLAYGYGHYHFGFDQGSEQYGHYQIIAAQSAEEARGKYLEHVPDRVIDENEQKRVACTCLCLDTPQNRQTLQVFRQEIHDAANILFALM